MYPISNAVKALFEAEQRQVLRITGTDKNGAAIAITEADVMENGFNIDRFSCNGNKLEIDTACSSELTLKLDNRQGQFNNIVFEGTELFVEIGIAGWTQTNPTVTYIPCGYFTPDEQPRSLSTITIKALDRMMNFDAVPPVLTPWVTSAGQPITDSQGNPLCFVSNVRFPITVSNLVQRVALLCRVPFDQSLTLLPNYNYTIPTMPSLQQPITFRNLIQWCAGIMGTNAWIDWDGKLRFSWYDNTTNYTMNTANRFTSDLYENALSITGVMYTDSDESKTVYIAGTKEYALDLSGNYCISPSDSNTILNNIYRAVRYYAYTPFSASVINVPYLWPMDRVTFTDKNGNGHVSLLTNVNFGINGTTELKAAGQTAQTNGSTAPNSFTNQQIQQIESFQSKNTDAVEHATQMITGGLGGYVILSVNEQTGQTEEILIMDTPDKNTAVNVWRWNQGGLGHSSNGYDGPYNDIALTADGKINANMLTAGIIQDASGENYWILSGNASEFVTKKGIVGDFTLENGYMQYGVMEPGGNGAHVGKDGISYFDTIDSTDLGIPQNFVKTEMFAQGIKIYWNNVLRTMLYNYDGGLTIRTYDNNGNVFYPMQVFSNTSTLVYFREFVRCFKQLYVHGEVACLDNLKVSGNLTVSGTKSRVSKTDQYSDRLLYCYETPSPMFGDVGEGIIGDDGLCYITIDPIFAQTISTYQYQVFLQKYGDGDAWVQERKGGYFIVHGTPGLSFGWEIKGKQKDYDQHRLDIYRQEERKEKTDYADLAAQYIERIKQGRIPE